MLPGVLQRPTPEAGPKEKVKYMVLGNMPSRSEVFQAHGHFPADRRTPEASPYRVSACSMLSSSPCTSVGYTALKGASLPAPAEGR